MPKKATGEPVPLPIAETAMSPAPDRRRVSRSLGWFYICAPAMAEVWLGDVAFSEALRAKKIELSGRPALTRQFPSWLLLSQFAPAATRRMTGIARH